MKYNFIITIYVCIKALVGNINCSTNLACSLSHKELLSTLKMLSLNSLKNLEKVCSQYRIEHVSMFLF